MVAPNINEAVTVIRESKDYGVEYWSGGGMCGYRIYSTTDPEFAWFVNSIVDAAAYIADAQADVAGATFEVQVVGAVST